MPTDPGAGQDEFLRNARARYAWAREASLRSARARQAAPRYARARGRGSASGRLLVGCVRLVLAVLLAAPVVILVLYGIDDWRHVGDHAVPGTATTTRCEPVDPDGDSLRCYGDFTATDGSLRLRGVEILDEQVLHRTAPATSAASGGWAVSGTSPRRIIGLTFGHIVDVGLIWIFVYGAVIMGLLALTVVWTLRSVGRSLDQALRATR